jgi:hypothetical protein
VAHGTCTQHTRQSGGRHWNRLLVVVLLVLPQSSARAAARPRATGGFLCGVLVPPVLVMVVHHLPEALVFNKLYPLLQMGQRSGYLWCGGGVQRGRQKHE